MLSSPKRWRDVRELHVRVPANVVFRDMAEETVVLNIESGRYHGIDPIGARFFEVMRSGDTLAKVASVLAAEYNQPLDRIQQDLIEFCEIMAQRGLIDLDVAPR